MVNRFEKEKGKHNKQWSKEGQRVGGKKGLSIVDEEQNEFKRR